MRKIPVCDLWARHWAEFEELGGLSVRAQSDARSKIGHLALWVMDRTGKPVAEWPDALALLDPTKAPVGVADYVAWKENDGPRPRWAKPSSITRGCGVLAKFFGTQTSVTRGCEASARITAAFRDYRP